MPDVKEQLVASSRNLRKWPDMIAYICDPNMVIPDSWFDAEFLPVYPAGGKDMGFITTEGAVHDEALSAATTSVLQRLRPQRSDLESIAETIKIGFSEDNAWVQSLANGVPFEDWPAASDGPWRVSRGSITQLPEYRLIIIAQDGVGSNARYRVLVCYRIKLNTKDSRTLSRTTDETNMLTFDLLEDNATGLTSDEYQNGPAYTTPVVP